MQLLVSGATVDVRKSDPQYVGVLFQPFDGNDTSITEGRTWAADNAAFSGFDAKAYVRMLDRLRGIPGCRWVAIPDVVGNHDETLRLFNLWAPMVKSLGFPVAFVAQDGCKVNKVPWNTCDALFIGGTTAFKKSWIADEILAYAAARGKDRHVGRVNSFPRTAWFWNLALTIDGSGFSKWPKRIQVFVEWAKTLEGRPARRAIQPEFFDGED